MAVLMRHIDPHVHCRDWGEFQKATIAQVMALARSQGIAAVVDMPNTRPPITTGELVERRLQTAESEGCLDGYYLWIGATKDPEQTREAAEVAATHPRVMGIKLYAGRSVGDLAIIDAADQLNFYQILANAGYTGVVTVHCEDESMFKPGLFDPAKPDTWNLARPPEAEISSVLHQLAFVEEVGFKGHLHIAHISVPEAVNAVNEARGRIRVSCGITPHHLMLSANEMLTPAGLMYKVNPPLRDRSSVQELRDMANVGMIDWIETDHAPHLQADKTYEPGRAPESYMSGIPSLNYYPRLLDSLREDGFSEQTIQAMTYLNIKRILPKIKE